MSSESQVGRAREHLDVRLRQLVSPPRRRGERLLVELAAPHRRGTAHRGRVEVPGPEEQRGVAQVARRVARSASQTRLPTNSPPNGRSCAASASGSSARNRAARAASSSSSGSIRARHARNSGRSRSIASSTVPADSVTVMAGRTDQAERGGALGVRRGERGGVRPADRHPEHRHPLDAPDVEQLGGVAGPPSVCVDVGGRGRAVAGSVEGEQPDARRRGRPGRRSSRSAGCPGSRGRTARPVPAWRWTSSAARGRRPGRPSPDQPLDSRCSSWRAGSSVTPPCTGPGWTTVLRGALRKPNRVPIGCRPASPPRSSPAQTPSTNAERLAHLVDVDARVERRSAVRGRRSRSPGGSRSPGSRAPRRR